MKKKERWVVFREEGKLVSIMDEVAVIKGINRSDFIREAIRKRLTELGFSFKQAKTTPSMHRVLETRLEKTIDEKSAEG